MNKFLFFLFFSIVAIISFRGINMYTNNSNSQPRIVSLSPSITKKIIELKKSEYLVGRTSFCNYNEVKNIEVVSDFNNINIDKIIIIHPTHVISEYPIDDKTFYILRKNKINVISLNTPKSIDEIIKNTKIISEIVGSKTELETLVNKINNLKPIEKLKNHSMYYVLSTGTSEFTAGKDTYINDFINLIGGKNIANNVDNWSYSKEYLLNSNPDIIISDSFNINEIAKNKQYRNITAIKEKNYIYIIPDIINVPTLGNIIESYKYVYNQNK